MNSGILHFGYTVPATARLRAGVKDILQRLRPLPARYRYSEKPVWAHVPDRVWRRNSALLTCLHEATPGSR